MMKIFLCAGEASGDQIGSGLMKALKASGADVSFSGVGGSAMEAEGLHSIFPMETLSVMGIWEIIPHLARLKKAFDDVCKSILEIKPDVVVTIDSPGFNFRLARFLKKKKLNIPVVHYVAPSVWAWRPQRARQVAKFLDHLLTLFPFEPAYFHKEGLPATYVGHPFIEADVQQTSSNTFRSRHDIPLNDPLLCVLPGSRVGELTRLSPIFYDTLKSLSSQVKNLHIVLPTLPHLLGRLQEQFSTLPCQILYVLDKQEKLEAFRASTAALAASGTVALELAIAGIPMVVAYRLNAVTAFLLKKLIKTPYVSLPNILVGEKIVPELLQENCVLDKILSALTPLLADSPERETQLAGLKEVSQKLLLPAGETPSRRAAQVVLSMIAERKK